MSTPLTDRSGVFCRNCFRTIDLTEAKTRQAVHRVGLAKRMMANPTAFTVTCPHCGKDSDYYYSSIRPIAPSWSDEKERLEAQIRSVEHERDVARADAKAIAKQYHQEHPESEEPDEPSSIPKDTAQKPPTSPEGPRLDKRKTPGVV